MLWALVQPLLELGGAVTDAVDEDAVGCLAVSTTTDCLGEVWTALRVSTGVCIRTGDCSLTGSLERSVALAVCATGSEGKLPLLEYRINDAHADDDAL